jgi:Mn-dependent DtxR family transcriptional regulator
LRAVREGIVKPKDIAKYLVTDKKEVEKEIEELKLKGYLSKDGKLTSKGLETIQQ